jgi:casein kinase II subunit beta
MDHDSSWTSEEDSSFQNSEEQSWISWFCSIRGNEFFCEVEEDYIHDEFNLTGLSAEVPYFDYALDTILDVDSPNADMLTDEQQETVDAAAELLYGLIHARYILSSKGLHAMVSKIEVFFFILIHLMNQMLFSIGFLMNL